ncbi:patatin-like phospholipase family protein [Microbacterium sp. AZCO]|uniref:patatin-like phospholipase family protein n=1 Tax=Microbacterium sp. AZCO TaxID=3142976 RepID=UPI0031F3C10C
MTGDGDAPVEACDDSADVDEADGDAVDAPAGAGDDAATIGVAISGGGLRATIFSLGAILYLVHSGANRHVRLVTSVSGGSITNALLTLLGDFSQADESEVRTSTRRAARVIAKTGTFFFPSLATWGTQLLILLLFPVVMFLWQLWEGVPIWDALWQAVVYGVGLYVVLMLIYQLGAVILLRRGTQIGLYNRLLATVLSADDAKPKEVARKASECQKLTLGEIAHDSNVRHVFCATELVSGRPFYMSPTRISSPAFGSCDATLKLSEAIYASAAFPGVFPPLRVSTAELGLRGGDEPERPRRLVLADGGVANNLGTDWFDESARPLSLVHDFGEVPSVARKVIINASAPRRVVKIAGWWPMRFFQSLMRIFGVMYENTVTPRLAALKASADDGHVAIVDIAFSTGATARALCGSQNELIKGRAKELARLLGESTLAGYLDKIAVRSSGLRTTLGRIGDTTTIQLLVHGYVSAMVSCHASFGTGMSLPDLAWFEDLVLDGPKAAASTAPHVEPQPAAVPALAPQPVVAAPPAVE